MVADEVNALFDFRHGVFPVVFVFYGNVSRHILRFEFVENRADVRHTRSIHDIVRFDVSKFGRVAYLRLKVTMNQFRGYSKQTGQAALADIFGTIDGYELYGDRDKKLLLYTYQSQQKKIYRRKKAGQPPVAPNAESSAPAPTATDTVAPEPASPSETAAPQQP